MNIWIFGKHKVGGRSWVNLHQSTGALKQQDNNLTGKQYFIRKYTCDVSWIYKNEFCRVPLYKHRYKYSFIPLGVKHLMVRDECTSVCDVSEGYVCARVCNVLLICFSSVLIGMHFEPFISCVRCCVFPLSFLCLTFHFVAPYALV